MASLVTTTVAGTVTINQGASGMGMTFTTPSTGQNSWITWKDGGTTNKWEIGKNTVNKLYIHNYATGASALEFDAASNATFTGSLTTSAAINDDWIVSFTNTNASGWGTLLKGGGANNADYSLLVRNQADTDLFKIMGDGAATFTGTTTFTDDLYITTDQNIHWSGNYSFIQGNGANTSGYLKFYTSDVVRLTIEGAGDAVFANSVTVSGRVGVGMSPISTAGLVVNHTGDYTLGLYRSGTPEWFLKTYTNGNFAIHENGVGDKFTIAAGGNATFNNDLAVSAEVDASYGLDWSLSQTIKGRLGYGTGFVYVGSVTANGILKLVSGNGVAACTFDASQNATFGGNIALADDKFLKFGASDDLTIQHHNSGYGHLQNTGTLYLDCEVLSIRTDNSNIQERVSISAAGATVISGTTLNMNYSTVAVNNGTFTVSGNVFANGNNFYYNTKVITSSYVSVFDVNNTSGLSTDFSFSVKGTANSVVIPVRADVLTNHYQDITIKTQSGAYTTLTIKVTTANNEDCTVWMKQAGANNVTCYIYVQTTAGGTVDWTPSEYSGSSLEHVCGFGFAFSTYNGGSASTSRLAGGGELTLAGGLTATTGAFSGAVTTAALAATTGSFGGHVTPSSNVSFNLGSSGLRWLGIYGNTANFSGALTGTSATFSGLFKYTNSPAGNNTGDLKIIPSANASGGVGYATQIIGVNIADALSNNLPKQFSTWGGVTGSAAIAINADDNSYGQFIVLTAPQSSSANTELTPRFWITGAGDAKFSGTLTANSTIQVSRSGASPLFQATDADAGGGAKSRWFGLVDGTSRFAIYGTNGSTEEFKLDDGGSATFSGALTAGGAITSADFFKSTGSNLKFSAGGTHVFNVDVNKNIYPETHNTTDLGFSATLAFRQLYIGNVYANGDSTFGGALTVLGVTAVGSYTTASQIQFRAPNNGTSFINFYDNNPTEGCYIKSTGQTYGGKIHFGARWDDHEDKIVFDLAQSSASAGYDVKVGIGTATPAGLLSLANETRTLDVKLKTSPATGDMGVQFRAGSGDYLGLAAGGGTGIGIVIDDSNKVGIGTSAPSGLLDLYEPASGDNKLRFHSATTGTGTSNGSRIGLNGSELFINNLESSTIKIYTQSTQTNGICIANDGKVGVGTVTAHDKLHVQGNILQLDGSPEYHFGTTSASHRNWRVACQENVSQGFEIASGTTSAGTGAPSDTYTNRFVIKGATGQIQFNSYGGGTHTGTSAYKLSVDASGNIIETSIGSGAVDGSGTTNYISKWTDSDTLGNSSIHEGAAGSLQIEGPSAGRFLTLNAPTTGGYITFETADTAFADIGTPKAISGIATYSTTDLMINARSGAKNIVFGMNGYEKVRIDSNGRVGIGTNVPGTKLEIRQNGAFASGQSVAVQMASALQAFGGNNDMRLYFHEGGTTYRGMMGYAHAGSTYMGIWDSGSNLNPTLVCQTGKVGIGYDSPECLLDLKKSLDAPLRINLHNQSTNAAADATISFETNGQMDWGMGIDRTDGHFKIGRANTLGTNTVVQLDGSGTISAPSVFIDASDGKVGIGTATPGAKLHVYGGNIRISSTDDKPQLEFFETAAARWVIGHSTAPNNYFAISEGSDIAASERLVIAPTTGKVGIGTTAPSSNLHVNYEISVGTDDDNRSMFGYQLSNSRFYLGTRQAGANYFDTVSVTTGKVGIGVADPDAKLEIKGAGGGTGLTFKTTDVSDNENFYIMDGGRTGVRFFPLTIGIPSGTSNATHAALQVEESGIFTVLSAAGGGKVGVGTTAPNYKLEVRGTDNNQRLGIQPNTATAKRMHLAYNSYLSSNTNWYGSYAGSTGMITFYEEGVYQTNVGGIGFNIDRIASDNTAVGVNPAPKMIITTDSKVGIGTAAPATPLHVWSTSYPQFRVSYNSALYFTLDHAATLNVYGNDWYVRLNGSEKFRIKQDGKIGIGTNNPLNILTLHQAAGANIRFQNATTGRYFIVGEGVGANDKFSFRGNSYRSTDTLTVDFTNNRVGVNNISPATTLDVDGTGNFTSALTGSSTITSSTGTSSAGNFFGTGNGSNFVASTHNATGIFGHFRGERAGTTKYYLGLDASDNFAVLDSGANRALTIDTAGGTKAATFFGDVKAAQFYTGYDWTTRSGGLNIGSQGISTGAVTFYDGVLASSASIYRDSSSVFFVGARGGVATTGMAIDTNGNVGIGDSTPNYKLDVNGTGRFTGTLTAAGATFNGVVLPSADGTYNLGDNTTRWATIFADTFYGNGANITSLNASNLSSGTVASARLGTGTASSTTYLAGNGTWSTPSGGGGGDTVSITASADDILSVSSGAISGVDAGSSDKIVFWDNSQSKLTYLAASTGLYTNGTNLRVTATVAMSFPMGDASGTATPSSNQIECYGGGTITVSTNGGNQITWTDSSSSDYRLKSNISTFNSEAWTKVKSVNLRRFDFDEGLLNPKLSTITNKVGFIAHELAEAGIEGAVEGTKDEVDSDGNPVYQKVCHAKLIPVMWGALKEAIARIETLETKVQTLENS